jgi:anaerobic ribonucleoside-triphosphate reductase
MKIIIEEYCIECGEIVDFTYNGEQWLCLNCGSYDSQGGFSDTDPMYGTDDDSENSGQISLVK